MLLAVGKVQEIHRGQENKKQDMSINGVDK